MIVFAQEHMYDIWDEIIEISSKHWSETESYRHGQRFNPDRERYFAFDQMGIYHQFTARDEGRLVGYGGIYVMPSMHTQQLIASEDTYFLLPEYRKGRNALNFFRFMEQRLAEMGVIEISLSTKNSNPTAEKIVSYMKYEFVEKRWSKHIGVARVLS